MVWNFALFCQNGTVQIKNESLCSHFEMANEHNPLFGQLCSVWSLTDSMYRTFIYRLVSSEFIFNKEEMVWKTFKIYIGSSFI